MNFLSSHGWFSLLLLSILMAPRVFIKELDFPLISKEKCFLSELGVVTSPVTCWRLARLSRGSAVTLPGRNPCEEEDI